MANLIGSKANQVSTNGMFGDLAFMNKESVVIAPQPTSVPKGLGEMCFERINDTTLRINMKGLDGTVRSVDLTLA